MRLEPILKAEGLTIEQWRVLRILSDGQGWAMGDLADTALLTLPTLTRIADRLVERGLIFRAMDPGDRRKVVINLSATGRAIAERLHVSVLDHQQRLFMAFGDERSSQLMLLLDDLIRTADDLAARPEPVRRPVCDGPLPSD